MPTPTRASADASPRSSRALIPILERLNYQNHPHRRHTHPQRSGRYWIDLARAYHQWGKPQQCYQALLHAERAAPADVRYRPPVHRMVEDLLRADRRRTLTDLPAFARWIGFQPGAPSVSSPSSR